MPSNGLNDNKDSVPLKHVDIGLQWCPPVDETLVKKDKSDLKY